MKIVRSKYRQNNANQILNETQMFDNQHEMQMYKEQDEKQNDEQHATQMYEK